MEFIVLAHEMQNAKCEITKCDYFYAITNRAGPMV